MNADPPASLSPIHPSRRMDEPGIAHERLPDTTPPVANRHLHSEVALDLGEGVKPMVYAEYTRHSGVGVTSIKIVDPETGRVILQHPSPEVVRFSEALEAYLSMGRRHIQK